jgi:hypothetical protein
MFMTCLAFDAASVDELFYRIAAMCGGNVRIRAAISLTHSLGPCQRSTKQPPTCPPHRVLHLHHRKRYKTTEPMQTNAAQQQLKDMHNVTADHLLSSLLPATPPLAPSCVAVFVGWLTMNTVGVSLLLVLVVALACVAAQSVGT